MRRSNMVLIISALSYDKFQAKRATCEHSTASAYVAYARACALEETNLYCLSPKNYCSSAIVTKD